MAQNCDAVKAENRGAIFSGVPRFCWQNVWFLRRGAILIDLSHYLSIL